AGTKQMGEPLAGDDPSQGESAADPLGKEEQVGLQAGLLIGEQGAGPAHSRLNFIDAAQEVMRFAKLSDRCQRRLAEGKHAARPENRLHQDGGGLMRLTRPDQLFRIVGFHLMDGKVGLGIILIDRGLARQAQGTQGSPVEAVFQDDDALFPRPLGPGPFVDQLDGRLRRLRSGVGEIHFAGEAVFHQTPGEADSRRVEEEISNVQKPFPLLLPGAQDGRVGVSQGVDGQTGEQVQVSLPVGIDQLLAFPALGGDGQPVDGRHAVWSVHPLPFVHRGSPDRGFDKFESPMTKVGLRGPRETSDRVEAGSRRGNCAGPPRRRRLSGPVRIRALAARCGYPVTGNQSWRSSCLISVFERVFSSIFLMTRAGTPATTVFSGTSSVTMAPAATTDPLPTRTPSRMTALAPITTSSSMITGWADGGSITPEMTAPAP